MNICKQYPHGWVPMEYADNLNWKCPTEFLCVVDLQHTPRGRVKSLGLAGPLRGLSARLTRLHNQSNQDIKTIAAAAAAGPSSWPFLMRSVSSRFGQATIDAAELTKWLALLA